MLPPGIVFISAHTKSSFSHSFTQPQLHLDMVEGGRITKLLPAAEGACGGATPRMGSMGEFSDGSSCRALNRWNTSENRQEWSDHSQR